MSLNTQDLCSERFPSLLGEFNAKVSKEDIFKPTIGNESLHEIINDNSNNDNRIHIERFSLKKLNDVEGKEQFRVEVSNRFAAMADLDAEVEINNAWETIRENITISAKESLGYFEFKKHKPWFDEGCSKLLDQRKQAKLQWL
jgi:hypothetical protein